MRLRTTVVIALLIACLSPLQVSAGGTVHGGGDPDGRVRVYAATDPVVVGGSRSVCTWTWLTRGEVSSIAPNQGPGLSPDEMRQRATTLLDGVEYRVYLVECPGLVDVRLVDPDIGPGSLEPPIRDFADELIEPPVPDVNPPGPGYVNLGMWLAVEPAAYDPITAMAGPFWMTVTPTLESTEFRMADGDPLDPCPGIGTPIVDLDTIEEGPCGHTYRDPGSYTITVVSRWRLPYESSSGSGELLPAMERETTLQYEVREIQTVGVSAPG